MTKMNTAQSVGTVAAISGGVAPEPYGMGSLKLSPAPSTKAPHITKAAIEARAEAQLVLRRLLSDQRRCQRLRRERGTGDMLASLTGASALDVAIERTRALVDDLDKLVQGLEGETPRSSMEPLF